MKYFQKTSILVTFLILTSCNLISSKNNKPNNLIKYNNFDYYKYVTERIDEVKYEFLIDKNGVFKIKNSLGKVTFSQTTNVTDFKITDFNKDGFKDAIIIHPSNTVLETLLLYKSNLKQFIKIANFDKYPNSKKIKSSEFYYSYQGAGCAQNDWENRLYLIKNYKIFDKGLIKGFGCLKNEKNGIYIYNSTQKDTVLLKYIKNENAFKKEKFEFLDNYWSNNFKKFK